MFSACKQLPSSSSNLCKYSFDEHKMSTKIEINFLHLITDWQFAKNERKRETELKKDKYFIYKHTHTHTERENNWIQFPQTPKHFLSFLLYCDFNKLEVNVHQKCIKCLCLYRLIVLVIKCLWLKTG